MNRKDYTAMKKYTKPQIKTMDFEVIDIISASTSLFSGIADIDESKSVEWNDKILDPKDAFQKYAKYEKTYYK